MTAYHAIGAALLGGLMLVGCGNAPGAEARRTELLAAFTTKPSGPPPVLTAALVNSAQVPLIGVATDKRQVVAAKLSETAGVSSFSSPDGVTLALRDRALVSVMGLQSDVMSSSGPTAARIASGEGRYQRSYQLLDGVGKLDKPVFDCALSRKPAEQITVAERVYAANVVEERCVNATGEFTNRYWIDGSGNIVQSYQWFGRGVDFLRLSFG